MPNPTESQPTRVHIVSATRRTREEFWSASALGLSLRRFADDDRLVPWIAYENRQGLPDIYNQLIEPSVPAGVAVFIHDDVWLDDAFFVDRLLEGLEHFDVIGLAGNRRRVARQPGWAFVDESFNLDERSNLSGAVCHGDNASGRITRFGPAGVPVELLDGIMIAAHTDTLLRHECRFDPRFKFDFYDLDFCRTARQKAMRLGTWPISVTHQSRGAFGTDSWTAALHEYRNKWPD